MIRQLAAVEMQAMALILRHQIHHRLPAIAGLTVHMLKQQQRGGAAPVKQFAVAGLRIEQFLPGQRVNKLVQRLRIGLRQRGRSSQLIREFLTVLP